MGPEYDSFELGEASSSASTNVQQEPSTSNFSCVSAPPVNETIAIENMGLVSVSDGDDDFESRAADDDNRPDIANIAEAFFDQILHENLELDSSDSSSDDDIFPIDSDDQVGGIIWSDSDNEIGHDINYSDTSDMSSGSSSFSLNSGPQRVAIKRNAVAARNEILSKEKPK